MKMLLREKIGLGLGITGLVIGLAGTCCGTYLVVAAKDALTQEAKYVQLLEQNSGLRQDYPQVNELYQQLKADPKVQESISNYKNNNATAINFAVGGGGLGLTAVGLVLMLINRKEKQCKKEEEQ